MATPSLRHVSQTLWLLPLPYYSESSNLLPPLVIYMHCSAIIQVIKTPAHHSLSFHTVSLVHSVSVYVKQNQIPSFICAFVACEYVSFCI